MRSTPVISEPRLPPEAGRWTTLVTGGAGFIGSHLTRRLLASGDSVVSIDNLQTGSLGNVAGFSSNPRYAFVKYDVTTPYSCKVDRIFNLACAASPPRYQARPLHTMKTSVFGALHALDAVQETKGRVLQASTSEVYGEPQVHPQPESYWGNVNPVGLRSCYDEGKRCAETILMDSRREYAADVRIARIFNTYGPGMQPDDGRVVSNFIVQALLGDDITIYGDGRQTRSFCYIDDMIEGLVSLMDLEDTTVGPVNLGNPEEFAIRELAELVLEITASSSQIVHRPLPSDDPTQRRPDISRARDVLGWHPGTKLVEGLKPTVAYFDALLSAKVSGREAPC